MNQAHNRMHWAFALLFAVVLIQAPGVQAATGPQLLRAGSKALEKRQYEKAVRLLKQAVRKLPHWGLVHLSLAEAMRFRGDADAAIAPHIKQAAKMLPKNPRAQFVAAQFYEAQGKTALALRHYQRALKLGHASAVVCVRVAKLYIASKQGKKALVCLNQLRTKGKLILGLYQLLAQARAQSGQIFIAGEDWLLALSRQPNNLRLIQRAYLFFNKYTPQQTGETKRTWTKAIVRMQSRMRSLMKPGGRKRRLRMLQPSRNQQR